MADDDRPYHERYRRPPPPEYLRYLTAPFTGYWRRQGDLAREGLAMAEEGAQRVRGGDLSGYLGMLLGPVGYVSSPVNALFPTDEEVYSSLPENVAPLVASAVGAAGMMAPGPKGMGRVKLKAADVGDAMRGVKQYPEHSGEYVYHTTDAESLYDISQSGNLLPRRPSFRGEQDYWPDGTNGPRSYWSPTPRATEPFQPHPSQSVLIRTAKTADFKNERGLSDIVTSKRVPASRIEYLAADGTWKPLMVPE